MFSYSLPTQYMSFFWSERETQHRTGIQFQICRPAFHSVTGALYLCTCCSIMGTSHGRLLLSLFYSSVPQSISNTAARAEPINHLATLLKQIAAS